MGESGIKADVGKLIGEDGAVDKAQLLQVLTGLLDGPDDKVARAEVETALRPFLQEQPSAVGQLDELLKKFKNKGGETAPINNLKE